MSDETTIADVQKEVDAILITPTETPVVAPVVAPEAIAPATVPTTTPVTPKVAPKRKAAPKKATAKKDAADVPKEKLIALRFIKKRDPNTDTGHPQEDLTVEYVKNRLPHKEAVTALIASGYYEATDDLPRLPKAATLDGD